VPQCHFVHCHGTLLQFELKRFGMTLHKLFVMLIFLIFGFTHGLWLSLAEDVSEIFVCFSFKDQL
jgi:hypothetical protein